VCREVGREVDPVGKLARKLARKLADCAGGCLQVGEKVGRVCWEPRELAKKWVTCVRRVWKIGNRNHPKEAGERERESGEREERRPSIPVPSFVRTWKKYPDV
jgi:hypothetical protein